MPNPVVAVAGSTIVGGAMQSRAASRAARAQQQSADRATDLQREIFERQTQLAEPFRQAGITSQNEMLRMLGLSGDPASEGYGALGRRFTAADMEMDPGYGFRLSEGLKALDRTAAARGGLMSGAALKADIDVHFHDGELEVGLHFHDPVSELGGGTIAAGHYEADEHQIFVAGPPITRPTGSQWDFAGAEGDSLWFLPPTGSQSDAQGKPYLGWGAEELASGVWSNVTFTLLSINGPDGGVFSVFSTPFGSPPEVKLSSTMVESSFTVGAGGHDHYTVAFNREGQFDVTLRASATRLSDSQLFTGEGTFTFYSGSVPTGAVPEPTSMAVFAVFALGAGYRMGRRRKPAIQQ